MAARVPLHAPSLPPGFAMHTILCFGEFELHVEQRRLFQRGQAVELGNRSIDLLAVLAQRSPQVVSQGELMRLVWPGLVVEPGNLPVQIWALRQRLGPQAIISVARRGYRFALPVQGRCLPFGECGTAPAAIRPDADNSLAFEDNAFQTAQSLALTAYPLLLAGQSVTLLGNQTEQLRTLGYTLAEVLSHWVAGVHVPSAAPRGNATRVLRCVEAENLQLEHQDAQDHGSWYVVLNAHTLPATAWLTWTRELLSVPVGARLLATSNRPLGHSGEICLPMGAAPAALSGAN
jgi:DNA-binding winged helix-turn-helix (wHTH) protein